jgi:PTH1 family peptidyl-tRNA hydrolase
MKMVVGLGNPGPRYAETRHNVGFLVVDQLADRHAVARPRRKFQSLLGEARVGGETVWLLQPQTYMNLSGEAVAAAIRFYQLDLADLLVIGDDLSLPLGRLRFRRKGSDGGHKGLRSIIASLGTDEFARLRLGIAEPEAPPIADFRLPILDCQSPDSGPSPIAHRPSPREPMKTVDYVLSRFRDDEIEAINAALLRAADGVETWLREGIDAAMNRFNG